MLGMFDTEATAKLTGLTVSTLKTYRSTGDGPEFVKIGRKVYYSRDALVGWLVDQRQHEIAYIAAEMAEEYKAEIADAVDASMKDAAEVMEAKIKADFEREGIKDGTDEANEWRGKTESQWRETTEDEFINFGSYGGDEFKAKWEKRYAARLRETVEADFDKAVSLL